MKDGTNRTKDGRIMMDRESIRHSLLAYLEDDLGETIPSLEDDLNIREGLGLDSVDVVGLVMQAERQFRIRLATEELAEIVTVGDMLDLLEVKIAGRADASAGRDPPPGTPPERRASRTPRRPRSRGGSATPRPRPRRRRPPRR